MARDEDSSRCGWQWEGSELPPTATAEQVKADSMVNPPPGVQVLPFRVQRTVFSPDSAEMSTGHANGAAGASQSRAGTSGPPSGGTRSSVDRSQAAPVASSQAAENVSKAGVSHGHVGMMEKPVFWDGNRVQSMSTELGEYGRQLNALRYRYLSTVQEVHDFVNDHGEYFSSEEIEVES